MTLQELRARVERLGLPTEMKQHCHFINTDEVKRLRAAVLVVGHAAGCKDLLCAPDCYVAAMQKALEAE